MNDTERVIGALTEFKKATERRLDAIEKRFDKLEVKVDALNQFRWRVYGGAAVLSVILASLLKLAEVLAKV